MRRYVQVSEVRVTCDRWDVEAFKRSWPCSGLSGRPLSFTFAKNGDLVDTTANSDEDGSGLLALCEDAKRYGFHFSKSIK